MDLHWFDGETVTLVDVSSEFIDQLLQLWFCFLPSCPIYLFSLWVSISSRLFLFFFDRYILCILTGTSVGVLSWALHRTRSVTAESLARIMNRLLRLFNLTLLLLFAKALFFGQLLALYPLLFFKLSPCVISLLLAKCFLFLAGDTLLL